jgi:hypothetical protein
MLHNENEVFQLRVLESADEPSLGKEGLKFGKDGGIPTLKAGNESHELVATLGKAEGRWHGIQVAWKDTIVITHAPDGF